MLNKFFKYRARFNKVIYINALNISLKLISIIDIDQFNTCKNLEINSNFEINFETYLF